MTSRSLFSLVLAAWLPAVGAAGPASAHRGGKAELFVSELVLEPVSDTPAWSVHVHLIDADSGRPSPAFAVSLAATGPAGEGIATQPLSDQGTGTYTGRVEGAPGLWTVTIQARDLPGGEPAIPVYRTWNLDLSATQATRVVAAARSGPGTGGLPIGPAAAGLAAAVSLFLAARRLATGRRPIPVVSSGPRPPA